ncbi:MAG: FAD-dependent oxidoreductase [Moraxellaceae bacterium]|nr:FAD-dependent oxidoreductase [Moraxellaceae bacterium]
MKLILGAGLSGLAASYHLGHANCRILERGHRAYGHIASVTRGGFMWDEGPHVSFTKHDYVKQLFADSVGQQFNEFATIVGNYFRGCWITHPAQVSLHQVPEPLRSQCVDSFLKTRRGAGTAADKPADFQEWLDRAFGPIFAENLPAVYTRKYWTRNPRELTADWIGERVHMPSVDDVLRGARGPLGKNAHYITKVRYPTRGGYQAFATKLRNEANIHFGSRIATVDLIGRRVILENGLEHTYTQLISTIPLPEFLRLLPSLPATVAAAREALCCTELMVINVTARHPTRRPETWFYVYDEDLLSTRINFTERLSPHNAPPQTTGIQVEVYGSRFRPFAGDVTALTRQVVNELSAMGLIDGPDCVDAHAVHIPWGNVVFDHDAKPALEVIWSWLEQFGLSRESEDTHPLTNWAEGARRSTSAGPLAFAGRYAQWKYFWTDDCVLRGQQLAENLSC